MSFGDLNERIEYRRVAEMPGVEVLRAERCGRAWRVYHETYSICSLLRVSGTEVRWTYRGKPHSSRAGGLMLMEPGEVHASGVQRPVDFRALFLAPSLVETAANELGMGSPRPHLKLAHAGDPALFRAFARFHAALGGASSALERESCLAACIQLLLRQCTETGAWDFKQAARSALSRARDLIREQYSRSIPLQELVAASGLSRYHLVRAFAKEFGLPPHAYQINIQIQKARSLLAAGWAAADVAAETGFADQSHLARHFKRINGVTPGQYRQGVRRPWR